MRRVEACELLADAPDRLGDHPASRLGWVRGEDRLDLQASEQSEQRFAALLDFYRVRWVYEPHTFVLERAADGSVREAFTPDFFLPELGLYVECTVMRQSLTNRKRRKALKARARRGVTVEILFRRDFERLARVVVGLERVIFQLTSG